MANIKITELQLYQTPQGQDVLPIVDTNNLTTKKVRIEDLPINANSITGLSPVALSGDYNDLTNTPNFSQVAFTGDYDDLINTPDIAGLQSQITQNADNITAIEDAKGQANGYASLDGNGFVPQSQLPASLDDVLEFPSLANFPPTGQIGVLYVALDTNKVYRWSGTTYIDLSTAGETPLQTTNTSTIAFSTSGVSNHNLTGSVKVSATAGNTITVNPDGLYSPTVDTSSFVNTTTNQTIGGEKTFTQKTQFDNQILQKEEIVTGTNLNWTTGNYKFKTITGNTTLTFTTPSTVSGTTGRFTLTLNPTGAFTVNLPATVDWLGSAFTTTTANKITEITFHWRQATGRYTASHSTQI